MNELRQLGGGGRLPPIEPQLTPPDDPDMEARLKRVEDDVRALRGDMTALLIRQGAVEARLGTLDGRVEGLTRQLDLVGQSINRIEATVRVKVAGPLQTFGLALGLLTASLTLPTVIARPLALLP